MKMDSESALIAVTEIKKISYSNLKTCPNVMLIYTWIEDLTE
jgi:hypothetical protein